jgi:hypothetical protein
MTGSIDDTLKEIRSIIGDEKGAVASASAATGSGNVLPRQNMPSYGVPSVRTSFVQHDLVMYVILIWLGFLTYQQYEVMHMVDGAVQIAHAEQKFEEAIRKKEIAMTPQILGGSSPEIRVAGHSSAFIRLPKIVERLNISEGPARYLNIGLSLEVYKGQEDRVSGVVPQIEEQYRLILADLTLEDLRGNSKFYAVKQKLLEVARGVAGEDSVKDILIQEILIQ